MPHDRPTVCLGLQLRHRIARRYDVVTELAELGSLRFAFTRVADPDRVLDQVAAAEDRRERETGRRTSEEELHLPYWAELWDSAFGIGQWLVRERVWTESRGSKVEEDQRVAAPVPPPSTFDPPPSPPLPPPSPSTPSPSTLDLGCGMGYAGTVAAACGHRVLFADLEPPALLFARLNSLPWRDRVRTRQLNWQSDRLDERFDLILGADILYERKQWDDLEPFWRAHLAPGGSVLLGEPGRMTGDLFVEWITQRGWSLVRHEEPVKTRTRPIRLFELRAKTADWSHNGHRCTQMKKSSHRWGTDSHR